MTPLRCFAASPQGDVAFDRRSRIVVDHWTKHFSPDACQKDKP